MPTYYSKPCPVVEHKEDSTVQWCWEFIGRRIDFVITDLLRIFSGIDISYINQAEWDIITDYGLAGYRLSALIAEPTSVKDLLQELTQHTVLLWWDEISGKVGYDTMIYKQNADETYNETDHIISGSISVADNDKKLFTSIAIYTGHRSPLDSIDDSKSYDKVYINIDGDSALNYDVSSRYDIKSRWLTVNDDAIAREIANRMLIEFKEVRKAIKFSLDAKDSELKTGDIVKIDTKLVQDEYGNNKILDYRVLEIDRAIGDIVRLDCIAKEVVLPVAKNGLVSPNSMTDYTSATQEQKDKYCFISNSDGEMSNGDDGYKII